MMTGIVFLLVIVMLCAALYLKMRDIDSLRYELSSSLNQSRSEMQSRLDSIQNQMSQNTQVSSATMQSQFRESAKLISEVSARLVDINRTNAQILDFSKQMQSLENILKNPKQRGVLGEYFLETLLGNVLQPNQYKMQHRFTNGEIVDAAVYYRERIIPIDAKFSLENYNRMMAAPDASSRDLAEREFRADVKKRIDETSKYIRPAEDTTDFAFMFVPAEGVYYNLLVYNGGTGVRIQDLVEYAFSKHVIIVSPTSFFAYLETVLMGLRAQKVEDGIREIVKRVHDLDRHLKSFNDHMDRLGRSISTSVTSYNTAMKEFGKIDKDVYRITDKEAGGDLAAYMIDGQVSSLEK
jgi:DNA recombination protein RmuC